MFKAYRHNYDLITEYGFYHQLPTKYQTELIDHLFSKFLSLHQDTFDGCDRSFVNQIVISLRYKTFFHNSWIKRGRCSGSEAYFIMRGGVAICENTCFNEPITVYRPGAFILMYEILMDDPQVFDYLAIAKDSHNMTDEHVSYDAD